MSPLPSTNTITKEVKVYIGIVLTLAILGAIGAGIAFYISYTGGLDNFRLTEQVENTDIPEDGGPVVVEDITRIELSSIRYAQGSGEYTFIEYTDLECPYCKDFHPTVETIREEYSDRMQFAVKHFPLNIHSKAKREAVAAECAGVQGKFHEYVNAIFKVTPSNNGLPDNTLFTTAENLGLNMDAFEQCVENEETGAIVTADAIEAMSTGGEGTPHSVIVDSEGTIVLVIQGVLSEQSLRNALNGVLEQ